MKDFIKFTFATLVGLILAGIVMFFIGISTMTAMLSGTGGETVVKDNSLMKLTLEGTLSERVQSNPLDKLMGGSGESYGLNDILSSIKKAKENEQIKGIYIEAGSFGANFASLQEIRNALLDFKSTGKFIYAYSDNYPQSLYYLSSVADTIMLNPQGMIDWRGLAGHILFYKEALDKLGVEMQIFKVGTYKSAVEPYIETKMSDANREQVQAYIGDIWSEMSQAVSDARNISVEDLNRLTDNGVAFGEGKDFVLANMIDTLVYKNDVGKVLKRKMGIDEDDDLNILSLSDMINVKRNVPKDKSGQIVAVYYASGGIDSGESSPLMGAEEIVSSKVIKDLKKLQEDEDVKAVVLRVNSPGGSAFGSEQIWYAIEELKKEKPVIVSMGDYAASGGYYISAGADYILAEPTTLTGSIGIFGMFPNTSKLTNKLGITFDMAKTNTFADMANMSLMGFPLGVPGRGMNPAEKEKMQTMINRGYELFVSRCAEGRNMTTDAIKAIAEGRVWTGVRAKELGLVDELGGIGRALEIAVERAGVETYTLVEYPAQQSFFDNLLNGGASAYLEARVMKRKLGAWYPTFVMLDNLQSTDPIQARLPYDIDIR
ncbi:MAG: signal peptide peptidase SppA [Prevotellaceae bacterium]|jgi:protease-4|nr:signal peptide peptidase SppA [Prevotellaceae bacterium]